MYSSSRAALPGIAFLLIATAMADWNYTYCSTQNTASDTSPFFWTWQSNGKCHDYCVGEGDFAFFVLQDKNCWCSNYIPEEQSDISDCSETCPGFSSENCGKANEYYVYVNLNGNPSGTAGASQQSSSSKSSSKSSSTSQQSPSTSDDFPQSTPPPEVQYRTVTEDGGSVKTVVVTPSATPQPEITGKSKSNTGAIVGGVVGGVGALAAVIAGVLFLLWRRRKQQREQGGESGEPGEPGVHRYASTMSKAGLLRNEKELQQPPPIATSFNRRHSRTLDQESISPISVSDRRNSSFRIADQRLNPSTIFVFDNTSRGSVGSLDDSRDYHRTLNVRNPDAQ